jgi:uncharacterized Zn-finger protein
MNNQDIVYVENHKVKCEGQGHGMGHPLVYLKIQKKQIECPYCSRIFKVKDHENN